MGSLGRCHGSHGDVEPGLDVVRRILGGVDLRGRDVAVVGRLALQIALDPRRGLERIGEDADLPDDYRRLSVVISADGRKPEPGVPGPLAVPSVEIKFVLLTVK